MPVTPLIPLQDLARRARAVRLAPMTDAHTRWKTPALVALGLALAGCGADNAAQPDPVTGEVGGEEESQSSESLKMAGTAWLSVSADGEVFTTYLDPDGRYRDVSGGTVRFAGAWRQTGNGELCFTPDTGEGACWDHGAPGLGAVMKATDASGHTIEVRQVAYTPPAPAPNDAPEAGSGSGSQSDAEAGAGPDGNAAEPARRG